MRFKIKQEDAIKKISEYIEKGQSILSNTADEALVRLEKAKAWSSINKSFVSNYFDTDALAIRYMTVVGSINILNEYEADELIIRRYTDDGLNKFINFLQILREETEDGIHHIKDTKRHLAFGPLKYDGEFDKRFFAISIPLTIHALYLLLGTALKLYVARTS